MFIAALALLLAPGPAFAHVKWFHEGPVPPRSLWWVLSPPSLTAVAVVAAITAALGWLWRRRRCRDPLPGPPRFGATPAGRRAFYGWLPAIFALHLAVPLLVFGVRGQLFTPNNALSGPPRYLLGLLQIGIALAILYGALTRPAALLLALVWLAGIFVVGPEQMLEDVHYLGFAAFFLLAGRGPHAIDRLLAPKLEPPPGAVPLAMPMLRVGVGLSLIVLAFTEKLARLDLAAAFLREYPVNFTPYLGLPLSDATFATCAGAVELLIGLLVLLGIFPRLTIVLAWIPYNLTLTVFRWQELVGHLPYYAAMAALLVWTPGDEDRQLWTEGVADRQREALESS